MVKKARTGSALGPSEILDMIIKNCSSVLNIFDNYDPEVDLKKMQGQHSCGGIQKVYGFQSPADGQEGKN